MYYFYCRSNLISFLCTIFISIFVKSSHQHFSKLFPFPQTALFRFKFFPPALFYFPFLLLTHQPSVSPSLILLFWSLFTSYLYFRFFFNSYILLLYLLLSISVLNIKFFAILPSLSRTVSFNVLLFQFPFCALLLLPPYLSLVRLELYPAPFCPTNRTASSLIICPDNVIHKTFYNVHTHLSEYTARRIQEVEIF